MYQFIGPWIVSESPTFFPTKSIHFIKLVKIHLNGSQSQSQLFSLFFSGSCLSKHTSTTSLGLGLQAISDIFLLLIISIH